MKYFIYQLKDMRFDLCLHQKLIGITDVIDWNSLKNIFLKNSYAYAKKKQKRNIFGYIREQILEDRII